MNTTRSGFAWLWLSALAIVLDQLSKFTLSEHLHAYVDVVAVTGFFNLVHIHNPGADFEQRTPWMEMSSNVLASPGWTLWLVKDTTL